MSVSTIDRPVSALRQRMLDDMAMRSLRSDTQRDYIRVVRRGRISGAGGQGSGIGGPATPRLFPPTGGGFSVPGGCFSTLTGKIRTATARLRRWGGWFTAKGSFLHRGAGCPHCGRLLPAPEAVSPRTDEPISPAPEAVFARAGAHVGFRTAGIHHPAGFDPATSYRVCSPTRPYGVRSIYQETVLRFRGQEMGIDGAYELAKEILTEAQSRIEQIRSEEDTKLQIITRLVTDVLGWSHSDIASESPNENGFSDYLVKDGDHGALVIEAKRIGEIEVGTQATAKGNYKLSGPVLRSATKGLKQVASYCHPLGVQLAVLTDGVRWIIFLPWVPRANYMEKQAILFPNFDSILGDFATFYELLSKEESRKNTFQVIFDRIYENRLVLDRPLMAPIVSADNALLQKSALAFDLENVFANFFAGMAGDRDPDMLIDCFVETHESRVADFSLEKITKNVLGNLSPAETGIEEGLQTIVQNAIAGDLGQTVFIVGPPGAGKTTFLDRFFARTLSSDVRERCVVIGINALDATGTEAAAIPWMTNKAIQAVETQIFSAGYPVWNDLLALYHLEYVKRSNGVDSHLYIRSKDEFKEKFARYVENQVEKDREGYLNRLLRDIVKNWKKLPIFIIDNTDEFDISYKTSIFQYFQSLRRAAGHCLLVFPATDRSAWSFSKTEIFNIYSSKSFFLPTPSPREVFRRRIEYLKGKLKFQGEKQSAEYFAGRGIRVTIRDLGAFAAVVESIFVDQDYAAKRVGELSNYNMREALRLSKRVITSSILNVEDLIRSYVTGGLVAPSPEKFMNALMKGDYQFFREGDEPLLFPLFQVDLTI